MLSLKINKELKEGDERKERERWRDRGREGLKENENK
jgi:hypothetical protein